MNPRLCEPLVDAMYRQLWAGRIDDDEPAAINAALERYGNASVVVRNRRISVPNPVSGIQDHIHPF